MKDRYQKHKGKEICFAHFRRKIFRSFDSGSIVNVGHSTLMCPLIYSDENISSYKTVFYVQDLNLWTTQMKVELADLACLGWWILTRICLSAGKGREPECFWLYRRPPVQYLHHCLNLCDQKSYRSLIPLNGFGRWSAVGPRNQIICQHLKQINDGFYISISDWQLPLPHTNKETMQMVK